MKQPIDYNYTIAVKSCHHCGNRLGIDLTHKPNRGYDPRETRYNCENCHLFFYPVVTAKQFARLNKLRRELGLLKSKSSPLKLFT